ncbi:hypothetical protein NIES4073_72560 [Kalymmatonema gypsitolerans NIES-4073]|nr:hypothetical protein NIES4073_72560 [Scytonema sp. NIES-4073]
MANIKISDLQSGLLDEISVKDLEVVYGGEGAQFVGSTSGTILGFSSGGGSTNVSSKSISQLDGVVGAFDVTFGTITTGSSSPF